MNPLSEKPSAAAAPVAWVGLDWADQQHVGCLYPVSTGQLEHFRLEASPEALQVWVGQLRQRFGGAPVAVVLEQARGALIHAWLSCEFVILYPINPQALAHYRKAYFSSGAKSDVADAVLLVDLVRQHPDRFHPWHPQDAETRSLQLLTEGRRQWVDQVTALTNQLTALLKGYYPQALELAGPLASPQACAFLRQWPTLPDLQKARPSRIEKFYQHYGRPSPEQLEQRREQIRQARPLTQDPAVVLYSSMMVRAGVEQLLPLLEAIEQFDQQIAVLFRRHPDRLLFESLPGAGRVLSPRLLAAFGADRERWQVAAEVQTFSGIAPVTEQSGQGRWVHWRLACPKFLRQTFHEFADHSRHQSSWARAFYQQQRARGKKHHAALRSLAYKWIRILFHCWKTRTPYQEALYLKSLEKKNPALWAAIQPPSRSRKKKAA